MNGGKGIRTFRSSQQLDGRGLVDHEEDRNTINVIANAAELETLSNSHGIGGAQFIRDVNRGKGAGVC